MLLKLAKIMLWRDPWRTSRICADKAQTMQGWQYKLHYVVSHKHSLLQLHGCDKNWGVAPHRHAAFTLVLFLPHPPPPTSQNHQWKEWTAWEPFTPQSRPGPHLAQLGLVHLYLWSRLDLNKMFDVINATNASCLLCFQTTASCSRWQMTNTGL